MLGRFRPLGKVVLVPVLRAPSWDGPGGGRSRGRQASWCANRWGKIGGNGGWQGMGSFPTCPYRPKIALFAAKQIKLDRLAK
jgi:hypothetical protein